MKPSFNTRNFTLLAANLAAICKGASDGHGPAKHNDRYLGKTTQEVRKARWDASGFSEMGYEPVEDQWGDYTQIGSNGKAAFALKVKKDGKFYIARLCHYDGTEENSKSKKNFNEYFNEVKRLHDGCDDGPMNFCRNYPGILQLIEVGNSGSIMELGACTLEFRGDRATGQSDHKALADNIIHFVSGLTSMIRVQAKLGHANRTHTDTVPANVFRGEKYINGKSVYEYKLGDYSFKKTTEHDNEYGYHKQNYFQQAVQSVYDLYLIQLDGLAFLEQQKSQTGILTEIISGTPFQNLKQASLKHETFDKVLKLAEKLLDDAIRIKILHTTTHQVKEVVRSLIMNRFTYHKDGVICELKLDNYLTMLVKRASPKLCVVIIEELMKAYPEQSKSMLPSTIKHLHEKMCTDDFAKKILKKDRGKDKSIVTIIQKWLTWPALPMCIDLVKMISQAKYRSVLTRLACSTMRMFPTGQKIYQKDRKALISFIAHIEGLTTARKLFGPQNVNKWSEWSAFMRGDDTSAAGQSSAGASKETRRRLLDQLSPGQAER